MIDATMEGIDELLRGSGGPPLKALHAPIDRWLASLPMSIAMACALGLFVVAIVWVWCLRREFIFRGAPGHSASCRQVDG